MKNALVILAVLAAALAPPAHAQRESRGSEIVIGQSVELSGPATGKENAHGAQSYFRWVNANGGVHGRRIVLKTYDDRRDPRLTRKNTETLLAEDKALTLFGYRSTPTVEAVLPLSNNELAFVNDTNFGSTGRNPNPPDYSDFIVFQVPGMKG